MNVAIFGSRTFEDYDFLKLKVLEILKDKLKDDKSCKIISGGARGTDTLAKKFADEFSIETQIFPADWNRFGKSAGMVRNVDIVKNCDIAITFWDGKSNGTRHSIELCKKHEKELFMFQI